MACYLIKMKMKTIQLNKISMQGNDPCENTLTGIRISEGNIYNSPQLVLGYGEGYAHEPM